MKKILPRWAGLLAIGLILSGCASAAKSSGMKVTGLSLGRKVNKSVAVQTSGGQATKAAGLPQVADKDLGQAIIESLQASGLFSAVVSVDQADYVLNVTFVKLNQPVFGFTMSVDVEILWSLTPKGQSKTCWEKPITTTATKGMGDAFSGAARVRITTEAAVQENIRQALTELSKADLAGCN
jgi:hypothetical protein